LKRAAKRSPLVVSAATGEGVPQVLRALLAIIDQARASTQPRAGARVPAWQP
jgi:GTP-binding protein